MPCEPHLLWEQNSHLTHQETLHLCVQRVCRSRSNNICLMRNNDICINWRSNLYIISKWCHSSRMRSRHLNNYLWSNLYSSCCLCVRRTGHLCLCRMGHIRLCHHLHVILNQCMNINWLILIISRPSRNRSRSSTSDSAGAWNLAWLANRLLWESVSAIFPTRRCESFMSPPISRAPTTTALSRCLFSLSLLWKSL